MCSNIPLIILFLIWCLKESYGVNIVGPLENCGIDENDKNTSRIFKVGYITYLGQFHEVYKSCYNPTEFSPLYTVHVINSKEEDKTYDRNFFFNSKFYNVDINDLYRKHTKKFMSLIPQQYEHFCGPLNYLARSQLTPRADFKFEEEQCVTEHYINTVPQFQSFSQGPWLEVENHVRSYLVGNTNATVITGVLGVLQLKNRAKGTNEYEDLYLGEKTVPVPGMIWKVIFYRIRNIDTAVIFMGNIFPNDPVLTMCPNICEHIKFKTTPGINCCYLYKLVKKDDILYTKEEVRAFREELRNILVSVKEIPKVYKYMLE